MRYAIYTYYKKPNGQIDETMELSNRVKTTDIQMANVILDFKKQVVVKCTIDGTNGVKDWDTVVAYYYPHYTATIERLFRENGHMLTRENDKTVRSENEKQNNPD
jgi:hypothetical protein